MGVGGVRSGLPFLFLFLFTFIPAPNSGAPGKLEPHTLCMASIRELPHPPPLPRRRSLSSLRGGGRSFVASLQTLLTDFPKFGF